MPTEHYRALIQKVDTFTAERVTPVQGAHLRCRPGCDACCRTARSAFAVEIEALRQHIAALSPQARMDLAAQAADVEVVAGRRCVYLAADGRCGVYAARPLLCRTHGPAVREAEAGLAWCGLNFEGLSAAEVSAAIADDAILNLDHLNQLLVLVNQAFLKADPHHPLRATLAAALGPAEAPTAPT